MSDSGREHKGGGRAIDRQPAKIEDPAVVPREPAGERSWRLTDPMRYVRLERQQAATQIQRSLRAWRKAGARAVGGAGAAAIPHGGGAPLPEGTRAQMEPHLGTGLGHARIHTGSESAKAAEGMNARAFTVGQDVHFAAGEFAPGTKEGDKLIAHELAHVVQAGQSGVQRKADEHEGGEGDSDVSQPHEPAEKEADAVAEHVGEQLHGDGGKEGGSKDGGGKDGGAEGGGAARPTESAPKVAAKLRPGVVHRNTNNNNNVVPPAKPPASGTPTTATTTPPPYDAKPRKNDELWTDCADPTKRTAAVTEMEGRGYNKALVLKILAHDNGKTMRPFVSCAQEDSHTQDRHILDGAGTIPDKKALALRVLRDDPPCPGKAGAFHTAAAADKAVSAGFKALAWPTLRDKIAKGGRIEEDLAAAVTGEVLAGKKVPAKELPPYAHPMGEGGRPLYPGDPEFEPEMKKLEDPPGSGKHFKTTPGTKKKAAQKTPIAVDKSNPLTTQGNPVGVHVRIVPDANRDGGWYIHSAWPY